MPVCKGLVSAVKEKEEEASPESCEAKGRTTTVFIYCQLLVQPNY